MAKAILKDPEDCTQISLIYCNQTPEDILLWEELDQLAANHDNFKVWYCGASSTLRPILHTMLDTPLPGLWQHVCKGPLKCRKSTHFQSYVLERHID